MHICKVFLEIDVSVWLEADTIVWFSLFCFVDSCLLSHLFACCGNDRAGFGVVVSFVCLYSWLTLSVCAVAVAIALHCFSWLVHWWLCSFVAFSRCKPVCSFVVDPFVCDLCVVKNEKSHIKPSREWHIWWEKWEEREKERKKKREWTERHAKDVAIKERANTWLLTVVFGVCLIQFHAPPRLTIAG